MFQTSVGPIQFATPLLLGSGYITESPDFFIRAFPYGCAGMVTRSLKLNPPPERARVPAPRYAVHGNAMLNCEWGNERPWTDWRDFGIRQITQLGAPPLISLSGRDIESCAALITEFRNHGVAAYEINVSCSHSGALHGNLNVDGEHMTELLQRIRPLTDVQIWVKLSYSPQIIAMAVLAEKLGADAIVCTNSIGPGLFLDIESATPELGIQGGAGGLTGPAIFPIALRCVYEISQAVAIPVVGVGGISSGNTAIQMLMAGASALQLYTEPALSGPQCFQRITREIQEFLREHPQYTCVTDLIGAAHGRRPIHQFTAPVPTVSAVHCTGCGKCMPACAFDAITVPLGPCGNRIAVIDETQCTGCNACVGVCPPDFAAITTTYGGENHGR